jgi:hypothetical protein
MDIMEKFLGRPAHDDTETALFKTIYDVNDRLCGLVVRVPGYRSRGLKFDSRRYQIFREVVGLERGPLSHVGTTEELTE